MLNKTTIHQNHFLIVGDNKIISNTDNQNKIRDYPKNLLQIKDIKNTKLTSIYSTHDVEFGSIECTIYPKVKGKKKPSAFYYIPTNSLHNIKIENLLKEIDVNGAKTGDIKIETRKICFHALGKTENKNSGYIGESGGISDKKVNEAAKKEFKKWNNSFIYDVENGTYEIFQFDFIYEGDSDIDNYDTMFSVKKK